MASSVLAFGEMEDSAAAATAALLAQMQALDTEADAVQQPSLEEERAQMVGKLIALPNTYCPWQEFPEILSEICCLCQNPLPEISPEICWSCRLFPASFQPFHRTGSPWSARKKDNRLGDELGVRGLCPREENFGDFHL